MPRETRQQKQARLSAEYKAAKAREQAASREAAAIATQLLDLVPIGETVEGLEYEGAVYQITHVQKISSYFDEVGFGKSLAQKVWNKVSVRKLDQMRLTKAITDGLIRPEQVAAFTTEQPQKAYPLVTMKQRKTEGAV